MNWNLILFGVCTTTFPVAQLFISMWSSQNSVLDACVEPVGIFGVDDQGINARNEINILGWVFIHQTTNDFISINMFSIRATLHITYAPIEYFVQVERFSKYDTHQVKQLLI